MTKEYVGMDLHRRRSVVVRMTPGGRVLSETRIPNDPGLLVAEALQAGPSPEVVLEATYGWYWAVDALEAAGARVHLAHPLGVRALAYQRVKRDGTDARLLADLLRADLLPEAWVAPPETRELRELVRYRHKLVGMRSGLKAQVHSVLAKAGISVAMSDLFGVAGRQLLDRVALQEPYAVRVGSLRNLIDHLDGEIESFDRLISDRLRGHRGYEAILAIPGVGPVLGAVFCAEVGEVGRFPSPRHLTSWAGLTPRHRESDRKVQRGRITKQGSRLVRWAAIEAVQHQRRDGELRGHYQRIAARRGKPIAKVAVARRLLCLVYFGLRDGEIRSLTSSM